MPALFCLRLAFGLIGSLFLVPVRELNPRFFRVHFLTALGLTAVAAFFGASLAMPTTWILLGTSVALCFLGSLVWSLDRAPGGRILIALAATALLSSLTFLAMAGSSETGQAYLLAE